MTDSYNQIQTELKECDKSITVALKVEHRDKAKIGALRTTHHNLTARLVSAPKEATSKPIEFKIEPKEQSVKEKPIVKSFKKGSKD